MEKLDFRKTMKALYAPTNRHFAPVVVPALRFLMVDGQGDPNVSPAYADAVQWLYGASYAAKFGVKAARGIDYVVPPLEGLWSSDDPADFVARRKDRWRWTMMIMLPEWVDGPILEAAFAKTEKKLGTRPASLRVEMYEEGQCLQALHIGSYDDEGPLLAELHERVMPKSGLTFAGPHHEIYLGDPRRTAPEKLRTILRQPVRPIAG
ncbi:MAG: hypothetical protein ABS76_20345 [Pelagibacterium sp. SCN 64-44]|nr:MAG: hypothetical protein ABS76_20345 [Pelagibacterium sp. SCN 64-44]